MALFWMQLLVVLGCIGIGGRYGGLGLGVAGGLGLSILVLGFGLSPADQPISVILIILSVITCVTILQSAGGLDFLVRIAEQLLRKRPSAITFAGPLTCFIFTLLCGTSYVSFSIYPVIAEVATEARVRPERALSMSVIAAAQGLVASPMSAATAAMLGLLAVNGVSPLTMILVCLPGCLLGCLVGCVFVSRKGKELADDPIFQRRVANGEFKDVTPTNANARLPVTKEAKRALMLFGLGIFSVVLLGSFTSLLPTWETAGKIERLSIPMMIQIVMLATACLIMVFCKVPANELASGSIFRSGLIGVVGVYGISWMTSTFFNTYKALFTDVFGDMITSIPMLFGLVISLFSMVIFSPAATVAAIMPLGISLGLPAGTLVALFPAACSDFVIPGGAQIGCVAFDRTGTTRIGKFVINHSYLLPGIVTVLASIASCFLMTLIVF